MDGSQKAGYDRENKIMTLTHSTEKPEVVRLHGKILYPFGITECPNGYTFKYKEIEDIGQDITDTEWLAQIEYNFQHDNVLSQFEATLGEGFTTSLGFKIDCKENNVADFHQMLTLLSLSGETSTIVRDYNNDNHTVSASDFMQLCKELGAYVAQLRYQKWQAIDAITTGDAQS